MIKRAFTCISQCTDPFFNQGLEKALTESIGEGSCILYLWQNDQTVVIGRNQDAFSECRVAEFEKNGGKLARRLSGGGAVFHDLGNLNYTLITRKEDFNRIQLQRIILNAVNSFGLDARPTGRNDLAVDGCKFSGTAYYLTKQGCFQHGTLLINGNLERMKSCLTVSDNKLVRHGVASVSSRVVNLSSLNPDITIESIKAAMIDCFDSEYGVKSESICPTLTDMAYYSFFADDLWRYGRQGEADIDVNGSFDFGQLRVRLSIKNGMITESELITDAMEYYVFESIQSRMKGLIWSQESLKKFGCGSETERTIAEWLLEVCDV